MDRRMDRRLDGGCIHEESIYYLGFMYVYIKFKKQCLSPCLLHGYVTGFIYRMIPYNLILPASNLYLFSLDSNRLVLPRGNFMLQAKL